MSENHGSETRVSLRREADYRFRIRFDDHGMPGLVTDEPPPLGSGEGPNPKQLLAAAIGTCLSSSLLFCMGKARLEPSDVETEVTVVTGRNEQGRLRIQRVDVTLAPSVTPEVREKMRRCAELYESFCTVTESLRQGIAINVDLIPRDAEPLSARDEERLLDAYSWVID